jgi:excisionase family DNA binding protein
VPVARPVPVADPPLSLGPASRLLGVDPDTLRRWADDGRIEAFTTTGGHRRFARAALERILEARRHDATLRLASLGATRDRLSRAYRRGYASPSDVGDVREAIRAA